MKIHDINSVLAAQLNKTSATHQFKTAKFFEHRLEYLRDYLAEAHEDSDFTIIDPTGRPRSGDYIRRLLAFAVAFGDREAAGQWALVAGRVYSAFSRENGGTERSVASKLNPTSVGLRLGELHNEGVNPQYAQLILMNSYLSAQVLEAWREGVPFEYLAAHLSDVEGRRVGTTDDREAVEFARRNYREGLPLEYALALVA